MSHANKTRLIIVFLLCISISACQYFKDESHVKSEQNLLQGVINTELPADDRLPSEQNRMDDSEKQENAGRYLPQATLPLPE